jgi:ribonuclease HII
LAFSRFFSVFPVFSTLLRSAIGAASAREVDRINIYHATVLAMRRALDRVPVRLGQSPHHVLVDGKPHPTNTRHLAAKTFEGKSK